MFLENTNRCIMIILSVIFFINESCVEQVDLFVSIKSIQSNNVFSFHVVPNAKHINKIL